MSHVAKIEIEINDLECLKEAAAEIGLEFRTDQKNYRWYGRWMADYNSDNAAYRQGIDPSEYGKCDHAIGIPKNKDAYEVGVCKSKTGNGYSLVWDFWQGGYGLENVAGKDCHKLLQKYSEKVAVKALSKNARKTEQWVDELGNVRIKFKVKEQY